VTARVYRVLRCNAFPYADPKQQCQREEGAPFQEESFRQLRKWMRLKSGWHARPGGRDICPDCWKAGHR